MWFYPPDALVHEAQRRGVEVLPPDVNVSQLDCRVETTGAEAGAAGNPPLRIGLGYVAEVAELDASAVIEERRRGGPYQIGRASCRERAQEQGGERVDE